MRLCSVWLNAPVNLEKVFSVQAVSRSDKKKKEECQENQRVVSVVI